MIFDPGDVVLKSIKLEKTRALWRRQLAAARLAIDRVAAARALGRAARSGQRRGAGRGAGRAIAFWGVRAAAARALGQTRRDDAREALVAAIDDKHPRVRRAVAAALGEFLGDETAARALAAGCGAATRSYFVEAEAALALGRTRTAEALALLPALLDRPSFQDVIRSRAIEGLGRSGDERAFPILRDAWRPGASWVTRRAIVAALAELARGTGHRARRRASSSRRGSPIATSACAARRPPPSPDWLGGGDRRARARPGRRARRPRAPPHGRSHPRPRGGHAPERGGPPAARRGRAAARRDR